jgi:Secretion system C-terminal sorting domain
MIRFLPLLFLFTFFFSVQDAQAQNYEWAFSRDYSITSAPSVFKVDDVGNFYTAVYTGSYFLTNFTSAQIEKRSSTQQLLWSIAIAGNAYFADIDFNESKILIVGYFKGTITINGNLFSSPTYYSGFIFECNLDGSFNWIKKLDPYNNTFKPSSIYIAQNSDIYITSKLVNGDARSAFHKLDILGNIVKTELPTRTDNENFSHIIADELGNVYLSGSCGNDAMFDNLLPNLTQSYQNFFIKYDIDFNAQFIITRNYITFDDESKLFYNGNHFFWAFHEIDVNTNKDTVRVYKILPDGQITNKYNTPMATNNSGVYDFAMNKTCTQSAYINTTFLKLFVYKLDNNFNITWKDTLLTGQTVSAKTLNVFCFESDFYITSTYNKSFLDFNGLNIINPFLNNLFVTKWAIGSILPLSIFDFSVVTQNEKVYLNWYTEKDIHLSFFEIEKSIDGMHYFSIGKVFSTSQLYNGAYGFIDNKENRNIFYRIKQVNLAGDIFYSKIIPIRFFVANKLFLFPNPTSNDLNVTIKSLTYEKVKIQIINKSGAIMLVKDLNLLNGSNNISLNVSMLSSGTYYLFFDVNGIKYFEEFIKN